MTVTYPPTYVVTTDGQLIMPVADKDPLHTALRLSNTHYRQHCPSPATYVFTTEALVARQTRYRLPVLLELNGVYNVHHYWIAGPGTDAITITIEEQSAGGGWSTIYGPTATAALTASASNTATTAVTVTTADEIRVTYTRAGSATYTPISLSVIPTPGSPTTRSGYFWPYDDGLLAANGAPINTELVNRALKNVRAVTTARQQCLFTFAQEDGASAVYDMGDSTALDDYFTPIATGIFNVPFAATNITVQCSVIASVDVGTTTTRVMVNGGAAQVLFTADDTVRTSDVVCKVINPGTLGAMVRMRAFVKHEVGQLTTVHAINAFYAPTVATVDIITTPDAPASWVTLDQATRGAEQLALQPWAQPALCFDGLSTADVQTRRFALSVGPALQRARMYFVRCKSDTGALQTPTTIATTSASAVPASPAALLVTVAASSLGVDGYYDMGGSGLDPQESWSSAGYDVAAPAATVDRLLPLTEALAAAVEEVQITFAAGCALHYSAVRPSSGYQDI
jgi:hypothetical protein